MYCLYENLFSSYLNNLTFIMIDNLISDLKKLIWNNLDLYFESYKSYNF